MPPFVDETRDSPTRDLLDIELGGGDSSSTTTMDDYSASTQPLINTMTMIKEEEEDDSTISSSPSKTRRHNSNQHDTSPTDKPNTDTGLGSALLDNLPATQQMVLLSFLMFLFFGMHNILQEALVNLLSNASDSITDEATRQNLKSNGTLMLGYAEVVGVLFFSYLERTHMTNEGGLSRVAPLRAFPLLTLCLFASSSLSNLSLSYINFPTKVVFRSCKLVPTMIIATILNARRFKSYEYVCALSICAGLVLFAMADYKLDPLQFDPTGLLLVSLSVVADAILPNAQEHLFKAGSSRLEVTVFSNLFSFYGMSIITIGNGTLLPFLKVLKDDKTLSLYFGVYTVLSYISISCYMTLVKRFGGVSAVVLTTARKAMTIVLSFALFPKGFSWLYVAGSFLVLGAVLVASICKKLNIGAKETPSDSDSKSGKYSLAYRDDERSVGGRSTSSSSSRGSSRLLRDGSQLESSAEAILKSISKRAHV